MKTLLFVVIFVNLLSVSRAQTLPSAWEELTASDFVLAVKQSKGVCVIPMGVIEKHEIGRASCRERV